MRKLGIRLSVQQFGIFVVAVLLANPSYATTLGGVVRNVLLSSGQMPQLLTAASYIIGALLGVTAIMKTVNHVNSPQQTPIQEPAKRFIAGGLFLALPYTMSVVMGSVADDTVPDVTTTGLKTSGATGHGLDAMIVKLIVDIIDDMMNIFVGFSYIAGMILIIIGISRLMKSEQEGAKGPLGIGTIMTFIVGGALLSLNKMVGVFSTSLFGTSNVLSSGTLAYRSGLGSGAAHAEAVIAAIIGFVAIVGFVSILRGFFIMKAVADGSGQQSMMSGITHLLGGALAVNLGPVINAVQETLGIENWGINFS